MGVLLSLRRRLIPPSVLMSILACRLQEVVTHLQIDPSFSSCIKAVSQSTTFALRIFLSPTTPATVVLLPVVGWLALSREAHTYFGLLLVSSPLVCYWYPHLQIQLLTLWAIPLIVTMHSLP
jgi:hypothetical protein